MVWSFHKSGLFSRRGQKTNIRSGKDFPAKRILRLAFNTFIIAAIISAICGCQSGLPNGQSKMLVNYQRSGGFAGFNDRLMINDDGHCTLQRENSEWEFNLPPDDLQHLCQLFQEADFFNLNSQYLPDDTGADFFEYTITYRISNKEHTVSTRDGAVPAALVPVLSELNRIVADNAR